MQVSRRDVTDALYDSFYCGSRDDIITKHYHSALNICCMLCTVHLTIDIDRWISTMRCDHFHTKAINNIISVFIWWRIQLMAIVWFWNRLHSFSAPDMTMTYDDVIDTLASIVVLMLVPNFPPMPTARTSTQLYDC